MMPNDLTEAERSVWAAFPTGAWVDLRAGDLRDHLSEVDKWGPERIVRARVIAALLLGAVKPEPGRIPAVRLRGVRVAGRLDLMGATVTFGFVCEDSWFDTAPRFVEATTKTVRLVNCSLPGFNGTRMRTEGIFNLHQSTVHGALLLDRATVAGEVCLRQAVIEGCGDETVTARGLVLSGDLDLTEMISHGPVRLGNARIEGSVQVTDAQISSHQSLALDATNAVIGAGFDGRRMIADGETRLRHVRIAGRLVLTAAQLHNSGGAALGAGGLAVGGGVWCVGLSAAGEMRFVGARLGANLTLSNAELCNPAGAALNLDRADFQDLEAPDLVVTGGSVSLIGAQATGRVNLARARLAAGEGAMALDADGSSVGRRLVLDQAHITGEVSISSGQLGARMLLRGAHIENPGRTALRLSPVDVGVDVLCDGMMVTGRIDLTGAHIGRRLSFTGAQISNPGGTALDARTLQATEVSVDTAVPIRGTVDFSHARISVLHDDPKNWPEELRLGGFSYEALEPQLPVRQRLKWLTLDQGSHSPQPYEQLATLYTITGQSAGARQVLYVAERLKRTAKTFPGRVWSFLQDITVGYGYRPERAVLWLLGFLAIGSITYAIAPPAPLNPTSTPHFSPVVYTLDLLLPVVDLGQKHAFNPAGAEQWLSYILVASGWVLATTIAASVARILTRR
jgi:hypothetical protein